MRQALAALLYGSFLCVFFVAVMASLPCAEGQDKAAKGKSEKTAKGKSGRTAKGKRGKKGAVEDPVKASGRKKPRDAGDINPTTVPIVDEDLEFSSAPSSAQIRAHEAHAYATGAWRIVAVLDGGFDLEHPAIAAHVLPYGFDAIDEDGDPSDRGDGLDNDKDGLTDRGVGHGTFVIGMILRAAPDVMILPVRVRDDEGWGTDKETLAGLDYALAMGADVINFSGNCHKGTDRKVQERIKELEAVGITIFVAAGNDGADELNEITTKGRGMAIGAVDQGDHLAAWSNWSEAAKGFPGGVVCAPGVDLMGPFTSSPRARYALWSGTSFAVAFASGSAAVVMQARPHLTPQGIYAHLAATCDPAYDRDGRPMPYGGRLNLLRAVTE